jgi:hypothetical protein
LLLPMAVDTLAPSCRTVRARVPTALSGQHLEVLVEDGDLKDLLTLPQLLDAAPFLTERWVRSMVAADRLPHRKLGRRLLFRLADVEALVEQQ